MSYKLKAAGSFTDKASAATIKSSPTGTTTIPTVQQILSAPTEQQKMDLAKKLLDSKRRIYASLDQFTIEDLAHLGDNVVIVGNRLGSQGELVIDSQALVWLRNYPGHKIEFEILQGRPYRIWVFDEKNELIDFIQLATIYKDDRTLEKTFHFKITRQQFAALHNRKIRDYYLNSKGDLGIAGRRVNFGSQYAFHNTEIDVKNGEICQVDIINEETMQVVPKPFCLVYDKETANLIDSFYRNITSRRFSKYDGVTIRQISLGTYGNLHVGSKKRPIPHFSKHPLKEVELDVIQGQYDRVRIYDEQRHMIVEHTFALIYDDQGKLVNSFCDVFPEDYYLSLKGATIKRLKLNEAGILNLGGTVGNACAVFSKYPISAYPDYTVNLKIIENGIVDKATLLDGQGAVVDDRIYSLVYGLDGKLKSSFYHLDSIDDLKRFGTCTIKRFWLNDSQGGLHLGKWWAGFTKYPGHEVEIDMVDGVVVRVRILEAQQQEVIETQQRKVLETCDFALIYDAQGKLVDSWWGALYSDKLTALDDHTIRNVQLSSKGILDLGAKAGPQKTRPRITAKGHPNERVVLIVKKGNIVEVQRETGEHIEAVIEVSPVVPEEINGLPTAQPLVPLPVPEIKILSAA
jgi:hypothetical protein